MKPKGNWHRKFIVISVLYVLICSYSQMSLAELKIYYMQGFGAVPFWEWSLRVMNANGSNKKVFMNPPIPIIFGPTISPDGKQLLFTTRDPKQVMDPFKIEDKLMVMNFDGSGLREFLANPPHPDILIARWSPDGTRVVFTASDPQQRPVQYELFVADAQGLNAFQINVALEGSLGLPQWFPDGQRIAFTILKPDGQLYMVEAIPNAKAEPMKTNLFAASAIAWSPDGTRTIVTGVKNAGERNDFFIGDAMGRNLVQLTRDDEDQSGAEWLPDGKHIVYTTLIEDGVNALIDIALMNVETKEVRRLTDDGQSIFAFWYDPTLAVNPAGKALTAWGAIKSRYLGDGNR